MSERPPFFVQREPRAVWHVESDDDPELMLCGETISVDLSSVRVMRRSGLKPCLWCQKVLADRLSSSPESPESSSPRRTQTSSSGLQTTLRDVTTRTGPGT